jgi:1-acyl-sn-glycerol-3-phosphate acyltransferase
MRKIRAVFKIIAFLVVTIAHYSVIVMGNLLSPFGFDKIGWSAKIRKRWGRAVCKVIGIKVIVKGTPPKPPFFLVSNHLSYIDVWVLFSQLKCTFIAKSDVRSWPIIGFVLASSGIMFVNRNQRSDVKRVNDEISDNLTENQGIVLFPEGTTSPGDDILPFKSSLLQYPAVNNLPVSSSHIRYESPDPDNTARDRLCWWDDTPFFKHLFYAFVMKEFTATITFLDETIVDSNRKVLSEQAEAKIRASYKAQKEEKIYA